jgi:hypothetical protein
VVENSITGINTDPTGIPGTTEQYSVVTGVVININERLIGESVVTPDEERRFQAEGEQIAQRTYWMTKTDGKWANWTRAEKKQYKKITQEKERAMNPGAATSVAIAAYPPQTETNERNEQREYLKYRINDIRADKKEEAKKTFGLADDAWPRSPKELIERIQNGKVTVSKRWTEEMDDYFYSPRTLIEFLRFRDPEKVEDKDGYKEYEKDLDETYQTLADSIMVNEPKQAMAEVQAWEAWEKKSSKPE